MTFVSLVVVYFNCTVNMTFYTYEGTDFDGNLFIVEMHNSENIHMNASHQNILINGIVEMNNKPKLNHS